MNKKQNLLANISNSRNLTDEDFAQIDYVNLHAHSTYSLQDAVGPVEDHFIATIKQGHCGCCITDHGSYASFADLDYLKTNKAKSKRVAKIFEEKGIKKHDVVFGVELYVMDDRHIAPLNEASLKGDKVAVHGILNRMSINPKWSALFSDAEIVSTGSVSDSEILKDKESDKIGQKLLNDIQSLESKELHDRVQEFCTKSLKVKSYKYNHITLMAKNYVGHQHLCHLTSIASRPDHFYLRPRVFLSELLAHKEGIVATTGCFIGMIPHAIHMGTGEEEELFVLFKEAFGDDFHVEIHLADLTMEWSSKLKAHFDRGYNPQLKVNNRLLELVQKYGMEDKVYITQDSHLPTKEHKAIQDILLKNDPRNSSGWHFYESYFVMNIREMYEKMKKTYPHYTNEQFVNWCFNSMEVLNKCKDVKIDSSFKLKRPDYDTHLSISPIVVSEKHLKSHNLSVVDEIIYEEKVVKELVGRPIDEILADPRVDVEKTKELIKKHEDVDATIEEIFKDESYYVQKAKRFYEKGDIGTKALIRTGLVINKFDWDVPHLRDRFFFELNTIQFNGVIGLSDYFIHFGKFSELGRRASKYMGPGRGSACGSYLSYALDITNIRPDRYDLLFERFLQEERVGLIFFEHSLLKNDLPKEMDWSAYDQIVELTKDKVEESYRDQYETELYYLECKPSVAHYLMALKEKAGSEVLKNEANSYIAFLLGITERNTDSINRTPPALPDIDYDSSYRDLICEYLIKYHGDDHFAYIGSYQSMKLKSAITDVLRATKLDNGRTLTPEEIKLITTEVGKVKISEEDNDKGQIHCMNVIIEQSPYLNKFFGENPNIRDFVESFLGTYKAMSIHAAGVILSSIPITYATPCTWDKDKGAYVTQLPKDPVERYGLVKKDLLGLIACELIERCAEYIKENYGTNYLVRGMEEKITLNLPPEVSDLLVNADTTGIFQQNTPTAVNFFKRVNKIEDAMNFSALANALLRPGPMGSGMHLKVADVLNGRIPVTFIHPLVEPVLKDTFGALVYQEQVMKICQVMGGLTALEADNVRKAMGKKKFSELAKYETKFITHASKANNVPEAIAKEMWEQMKNFAEYGFNKSHAVAYACVSCIELYFYVQYKLEWISALLSVTAKSKSEKSKKDYKIFYSKWKDLIQPPTVNASSEDYKIKNGKIYMPLHILSRVGEDVSKDICSMQPFNSFKDFVVKATAVGRGGKGVIEPIVYGGCCDEFMPSKAKLKALLEENALEALDQINDLVEYSKFFGREFYFESLQEIKEALENDLYLSEDALENIKAEIFNSGLFDVELTAIKYRKFMLYKYYTEYQSLGLTKKFRDALSELNMNTPENFVRVMEEGPNDILASTPALSEALLSRGKYPKLINTTTPKELEEAHKTMDEVRQLSTNRMILRQLEYLKFTTYDFSTVFKKEIKKIEDEKRLQVSYLHEIESQFNGILDIAEWHNAKLTTLIQRPIASESVIDVLVREKYLAEIYERFIKTFGWQARNIAEDTVQKDLAILDPKIKFTHQFYRHFLGKFIKGIPQEDIVFNINLNDLLTKEEINALRPFTYGELNLMSVSATRKVRANISNIQDLIVLKLIKGNHPILKQFNRNKTVLTIGQSLESKMSKPLSSAIGKLSISPAMEDLMLEGLRLMTEGLDQEKDEALINGITELREEMEAFALQPYQKSLMEEGAFVFGTIFRAEKKMFLRDKGRGSHVRRTMNVILSDKNEQLPLHVDYVEKEFLKPISVYKQGEKTPLVDAFKDFTPVIVKAKVNLKLNDFSCELQYVSGSAISLMELF